MFHGRTPPAPAALRRTACLLGTIIFLSFLRAAAAQSPQASPLRLSWSAPDHASAVYHVKATVRLTVLADNLQNSPARLSGEIVFGLLEPAAGDKSPPPFKPLSVIPIAPATLEKGQRAKIPLALAFAGAGRYELRWKHDGIESPIGNSNGLALECVFAPRAAHAEGTPWLTALPPSAFRTPGFLADFIAQTTIRRFLIDERFAFDPVTNIGLGFGASLGTGHGGRGEATGDEAGVPSAKEVDTFLTEASRAKASFILRVTLPATASDPRTLAAFKQYLSDAIRRAKGSLTAIAIAPALPALPITPAAGSAFQTYYLAGYAAAKQADKNIILLGAGSARSSAALLGADLRGYLDTLALADAAEDASLAPAFLGESPARKIPAWILPPPPGAATSISPAAALARNAAVVPVPPPSIDRGVTAHLLNGTVFLQRIHIAQPPSTLPAASQPQNAPEDFSPLPFIALFQGDGYSLAAIAGPGAGTDLDATCPALAHSRTQVEPLTPDEKPAYASIEVSDDTHSMRVVDSGGNPLDTRYKGGGDSLFVPVTEKIVYLLQAGIATDLGGSLRPATPNRLPVFEISGTLSKDAPTLTLSLQNLTNASLSTKIRLLLPQADSLSASVLAEKEIPPLEPGIRTQQTLDIPAGKIQQVTSTAIVVEATTQSPAKSVVQRTALIITKSSK